MRLFARAVRQPTAESAAVLAYRLLPNTTDFTVARRRGLAGFNFAFLGRPALYHAPQATPDAIDPGAVQHMGSQTLDLARALLTAPGLPGRGPDDVFADLFGGPLILYPAWGGWVVLGIAGALFAAAAMRSYPLDRREVLRGSAEAVGLVLVLAGLLQLANAVSGAGPHANYFGRLAEIPRLETQAALLSLAGLALVGVRGLGRAPLARWLGFAAPVFLAAVWVQVFAPGAAPVLAWPLLVTAGAAAGASALDPALARIWSLAIVAAAAACGIGWTLSLAHLAFLAVGPDLPGAMSVFALLVAMMARPLLGGPPRLLLLAAAAVLGIAGFGLATAVRGEPPPPTIPIYARDL